MLGYTSRQEFQQRNLEQEGYAPNYSRQEFKERLEREGEVKGLEAAWTRRDGTIIYVRENARVVRDQQGKVLYYQGSVEDISDRKLLERQLVEQQANFRAIAENATDGIMIADVEADGPNLYVNRRATELFGLTPEELQSKSVRELASPESVVLIEEYARRRLAGEPAPNRYDIEIMRADGTRLPVETTMADTIWRGRPAIIINLRDTSERRAMIERLAQSESRYRSLLEGIRDGVSATNLEGRFTFVNDTVLRRSGRPLEWWLGRHHADVVAPEYRLLAEQRVAATLRGEIMPPYEISYPATDGRMVHLEMHTAPLRDGDRIVGVIGIARDISDRKRAEKELQELSEQFRRMVELSPDGIAVHQDGRIVMVNPAGASVLGYAGQAELVGKPVLELVAPEDRPLVAARVRRVIEEGQPGDMVEERFVRKDGSLVHVEVINAPFIWRGRPAVQVAVRDITERKRLARLADETTTELHAILENSPEGVVAESDGLIVYANARFAALFGYDSPEQVVGLPATVLDAPEDRERLVVYTQQRLRGEPTPDCYRFKGLRRDGRIVEMAASISSYKHEGRNFILAFVRELPPDRC
jgi:PAS domain S-box-containing protein